MDSKDIVLIASPIATVLAVLVGSWLTTINQKRNNKRSMLIQQYDEFYVPIIKWFYELNPDAGPESRMSWKDPKVKQMDDFITKNIKWVSPKVLKIYIKYYRAAHEQGLVKTSNGLDVDNDLLFGKPGEYFEKQKREIAKYFVELEIAIVQEGSKLSDKLKLPNIGLPILENLQDMNKIPLTIRYKLKRLLKSTFGKQPFLASKPPVTNKDKSKKKN